MIKFTYLPAANPASKGESRSMRLLFAAICTALILGISFQAHASESDQDMQKMYSKDTYTDGSMEIFSTEDGSRVRSEFTATNGVIISLESTRDSHDIQVGSISLSVARLASGNVKVVSEKAGKKTTKIYSRDDLQNVTPLTLDSAFSANGNGMSDAELVAYSEFANFMRMNQPKVEIIPNFGAGEVNSAISLRCGLYVLGTGIIGVASAEACVASLGWTCAAGVVGTMMAWDATMAECAK